MARHIIENIGDQERSIGEIDAALEEPRPKVLTIEGRTKIHLHDRQHGYELTGFLHHNGYQIDEVRVFVEQTHFPGSAMLRWDAEIAAGTMQAARLIDITSLKERRVLGYQIKRDEGYTVFHLDEWDRDSSITWDELKASITRSREDA